MEFCRILAALAAAVAVGTLLLWRRLEPGNRKTLLARWLVTSAVFAAMGGIIPKIVGGDLAFMFVIIGGGVLLSWVWTPVLGGGLAGLFASFYMDDDRTPHAPEAVYSPAIAQRLKGNYQEAARLIRATLQQHPEDFRGRMLLAEILAENLEDLYEAQCIILNLVQNPKTSPDKVAGALNSLADWHLKIGKDPDAAREVLEQLAARFPNTAVSLQAEQRLAHLGQAESMGTEDQRKPIHVTPGKRNLGLQKLKFEDLVKTKSPEEVAQELVAHLEAHPMDLEAREHLARLYAEEFQQVDLAAGQLEQMIACPSASARQITQWLNDLAELQIRVGANAAAAAAALQRIMELYPGSAMAIQAQARIMTLANEMRVHRDAAAVKMGNYEQRLGLKMKTPTRH